jgi:hypothetical protein
MIIWYILCPFGTFCVHLVHFVSIWYIFFGFGIMYQEKSGNPDYIRQRPGTMTHSGCCDNTIFVLNFFREKFSDHILIWNLSRVTRCVGEKMPQNFSKTVFCQN